MITEKGGLGRPFPSRFAGQAQSVQIAQRHHVPEIASFVGTPRQRQGWHSAGRLLKTNRRCMTPGYHPPPHPPMVRGYLNFSVAGRGHKSAHPAPRIPRALSVTADPGLVWATLGQAQAGPANGIATPVPHHGYGGAILNPSSCGTASNEPVAGSVTSSQPPPLPPLLVDDEPASASSLPAMKAWIMDEQLPAPCEACVASGLRKGVPCSECGGKGYRLIINGMSAPARREGPKQWQRQRPAFRQR